jgi:hypothetical protein
MLAEFNVARWQHTKVYSRVRRYTITSTRIVYRRESFKETVVGESK